ncbi:MAG: proline racemase family protein, partial [Phyllobacterium sp.]
VPGFGRVGFDLAYGGAFYALADCRQFGLEFGRDGASAFVEAATVLTAAVKEAVPLHHPDHKDLAFLYGSILTDGNDAWNEAPTKNACIFADAQLDRSPTGSGVTARLAAMHAKGEIHDGTARIFESIVGSRFAGFVASRTRAGDFDAIIARVSGHAYYCGKAEFTVEADDPLGAGFLVP